MKRFELEWTETAVENGWVLRVHTVSGTLLTSFWIDDDELPALVVLLAEAKKS